MRSLKPIWPRRRRTAPVYRDSGKREKRIAESAATRMTLQHEKRRQVAATSCPYRDALGENCGRRSRRPVIWNRPEPSRARFDARHAYAGP